MKGFLRNLLLRGPILRTWVKWKNDSADKNYLACFAEVKSTSSESFHKIIEASIPLRKILFIADCLWEEGQLIPALQRIAETRILNLGPDIRAARSYAVYSQVVIEVTDRLTRNEKGDFDLIFLYARPSLLSDDLFSLLRKRWKCPIFGMNLDEKSQFFSLKGGSTTLDCYRQWACKFDLNLSSTRSAADWYKDINAPYYFLGMGFHPSSLTANPKEMLSSISFVGACRLERKSLVSRVAKLGVKIDTYGVGWPNSKGWVEDASLVYKNSQLNLGIGYASPNCRITSLKARDYECPGAGGCYLTTYNWELALEYDIGKEILCYREVEELAEMSFWLLKRPEKCREIATAGKERALREYTWEKRFRALFASYGFVSDKIES